MRASPASTFSSSFNPRWWSMPRTVSEAVRYKVADVDELPPGKGKTTTIAGREITVYNREGRLVATATASRVAPIVTAPPHAGGILETSCDMPGHHFDVGPAVSPDRLQSDDSRYKVQVDDGSVYVIVVS